MLARSCGRLSSRARLIPRGAFGDGNSARRNFSSRGGSENSQSNRFTGWLSALHVGSSRSLKGTGLLVALSAAAAGFADWNVVHAQEKKKARVFAWGNNQFGQLGLRDEINRPIPCPIDQLNDADVVQICAGGEHGVAVTRSGDLLTWGQGHFLALGHGDVSNLSSPTPVVAPTKFRAAHASGTHTAAIDENGDLWTWGSDGLGRDGPQDTPAKVTALEGKKIVSVACGHRHTLAVTADGELYSWGAGGEGALGNGSKKDEKLPRLIQAFQSQKVVQVAAGIGSSIVLTDDGQVYTFGSGDYGQTGHGQALERYTKTPTLVRALANKRVKQVAMRDYTTACVTEDGEVYAWGLGLDGQIGNGAKLVHNTLPSLVRGLLGKRIVQVACGGGHTAAVDDQGTLYLWGRGRHGQLGRGEHLESMAIYRLEPVEVSYFKEQSLTVHQVSLGKDFSLALSSA